MTTETWDAIVVGAGPAGSIVAGELARRGRRVVIIEDAEFPRFHIGESLLPHSLGVLHRVGALERVAAAGFVRKNGAAFLSHDGAHCARFDFQEALPASEFCHAYQVERSDFDALLLEWARDCGAELLSPCTVTGLRGRLGGDCVVNASSTELSGRFVVDATGLDSATARLRGWSLEPLVKDRAALFGHFHLAHDPLSGIDDAVAGDILIVECETTWCWFIPLRGGATSVGAVLPLTTLEELTGTSPEQRFGSLIATMPAAAARLDGAQRISPVRGARAYGRANQRLHDDGFVLVGDAAGFIDPIFSSGVCLALGTGFAAAAAIDASLADRRCEAAALEGYAREVRRAVDSIAPFVAAWYDGALKRIFYNAEKPPKVKAHITSVLAGELWNETNPIVRDGPTWVETLDRLSC